MEINSPNAFPEPCALSLLATRSASAAAAAAAGSTDDRRSALRDSESMRKRRKVTGVAGGAAAMLTLESQPTLSQAVDTLLSVILVPQDTLPIRDQLEQLVSGVHKYALAAQSLHVQQLKAIIGLQRIRLMLDSTNQKKNQKNVCDALQAWMQRMYGLDVADSLQRKFSETHRLFADAVDCDWWMQKLTDDVSILWTHLQLVHRYYRNFEGKTVDERHEYYFQFCLSKDRPLGKDLESILQNFEKFDDDEEMNSPPVQRSHTRSSTSSRGSSQSIGTVHSAAAASSSASSTIDEFEVRGVTDRKVQLSRRTVADEKGKSGPVKSPKKKVNRQSSSKYVKYADRPKQKNDIDTHVARPPVSDDKFIHRELLSQPLTELLPFDSRIRELMREYPLVVITPSLIDQVRLCSTVNPLLHSMSSYKSCHFTSLKPHNQVEWHQHDCKVNGKCQNALCGPIQ